MAFIKAMFGLFAVVAVVVTLFQVVPPTMSNLSFQDDLKNVALVDSANLTKTEDDVRNEVMAKAKEHDLPVDPRQVTVQRINTPGTSAVYVEVEYSVNIKLPGYSFDLHFNPNSGNKGL
jgi:hypothetical protein